MKYSDVYNAVSLEYGNECALTVCQILAIGMATKVKRKDLECKGRYAKRIDKKVRNALWETDDEVLDLALKCWHVVHDWTIGIDMEGLGGCKRKTIKELVDEVEVKRELQNAS